MSILKFKMPKREAATPQLASLLGGYSIEVMPRTAARVADFREILPSGTRVYIAHIEGTPIDDMVATARRIADEGFTVMPHVPARLIRDRATLDLWLRRYANEAGASEALVLAGGPKVPAGIYDSSMQLLESGLFDRHGFRRLHVAGHPEGNRDIDPDCGTKAVDAAAVWKQGFSGRTDASMALVTQFAFDAAPVIAWADRLRAAGVELPVHVGVAGPAKLQTLLKYAMLCGVGPSLSVLRKRAQDVTKLLLPFEPTGVLADLGDHLSSCPNTLIKGVHLFPLGGVEASAEYARRMTKSGQRSPSRMRG